MTAALQVVRAGLFDTVQDFGRIGFMAPAVGMPSAMTTQKLASVRQVNRIWVPSRTNR